MKFQPLPVTAKLAAYEDQAEDLLRGHATGDASCLKLIHQHHPRFLDCEVKWLPLPVSDEEIRAASFDLNDARFTLARAYSFRDWDALTSLVNSDSEFELASEAVITGDEAGLAAMLGTEPNLVDARSERVTCHDPAVHRATLVHYLAANGVESYRQKSPKNAVAIAQILLEAGADPNALASMYGGECTPLPMLVSSTPPAEVGVQLDLIETLIDYGADPNDRGKGNWTSPIMTALVFGFHDAAKTLARRGARVDRLAVAAGLGRTAEARELLRGADAAERHRALAIAVQSGRLDVARMLLDAGESPDRYNPEGMHAHATPLHQAALIGRRDMVQLLLEQGARTDMEDKLWKSTPRGWALHGGHPELAAFLSSAKI